jgi:AcrR family transcriptional regulator
VSTERSTLQLRRSPRQERSRATFEALLAGAAELLEERGFAGFTTNLLSERTGVSIQALYRYFPNKHAVVVEVARSMTERWRRALSDDRALADPMQDWRMLWCRYLDRFVSAVSATPGGLAVLQAMRSDPELRAVDDEANARYIDDIADALTSRSSRSWRVGRARARSVASTLVHSAVGVIDAALDTDRTTATRMIEHLKLMHLALLADCLDDTTAPR